MMKEVDIRDIAKVCITSDKVARQILDMIMDENPLENEIYINMEGVVTITCQCINIIFGSLYDHLGADKFHENIVLKGCSDDLGDFISIVLYERTKLQK